MSINFQIESKKYNGDWHINLAGDFDGSSACQLLKLLVDTYDGEGQVFIETRDLRSVCPFGRDMLRCQFYQCRIPSGRIVFKGERGYAFALEGSRVLVEPEAHVCHCNGNCAHCSCNKKRGQI